MGRVYVTRDFYGSSDNQLSVFVDDVLELVSYEDRYWWFVKDPRTGQAGYVPSEIIQKEEEAGLGGRPPVPPTTPKPVPVETLRDSTTSRGMDASWTKSGFAHKKKTLRSAPAVEQRHKKTVSFSERKPIEYTIPTRELSSSPSPPPPPSSINQEPDLQILKVEEAEGPLASPHSYYDHHIAVDPLVEHLIKREFGERNPEKNPNKLSIGDSIAPALESPSPVKPVAEPNIPHWAAAPTPPIDNEDETASSLINFPKVVYPTSPSSEGKRKKESKFLKKLWKAASPVPTDIKKSKKPSKSWLWKKSNGKANDETASHLVRIHAGNFTNITGYKSLELDEHTSLAEMARLACEKYGIGDDGYEYVLSVVHCETHEVLPMAANYPLGSVIELAKRATLLEGSFVQVTEESLARLPRSVRRKHKRTSSKFAQSCTGSPMGQRHQNFGINGSFSCLASPVVQHLEAEALPRDRSSDFVTHYRMVINRWLEGPPGSAIPFYMRAMMLDGGLIARKLIAQYTSSNTSSSNERMPGKEGERGISVIDRLRNIFNRNPEQLKSKPALRGSIVECIESAEGRPVEIAKVLSNTAMTVNDVLQGALGLFRLPLNIPNLSYNLFLATRPSSIRDRIHLTEDMPLSEVLQLRPMVDPSSLTLLIQPVPANRLIRPM